MVAQRSDEGSAAQPLLPSNHTEYPEHMPSRSRSMVLITVSSATLASASCSPNDRVHTLNLSETWKALSTPSTEGIATEVRATVETVEERYSAGMSVLRENSVAICRIDEGFAIPTSPRARVIHLKFDYSVNDAGLRTGDRVRLWLTEAGELHSFTKIEPN